MRTFSFIATFFVFLLPQLATAGGNTCYWEPSSCGCVCRSIGPAVPASADRCQGAEKPIRCGGRLDTDRQEREQNTQQCNNLKRAALEPPHSTFCPTPANTVSKEVAEFRKHTPLHLKVLEDSRFSGSAFLRFTHDVSMLGMKRFRKEFQDASVQLCKDKKTTVEAVRYAPVERGTFAELAASLAAYSKASRDYSNLIRAKDSELIEKMEKFGVDSILGAIPPAPEGTISAGEFNYFKLEVFNQWQKQRDGHLILSNLREPMREEAGLYFRYARDLDSLKENAAMCDQTVGRVGGR